MASKLSRLIHLAQEAQKVIYDKDSVMYDVFVCSHQQVIFRVLVHSLSHDPSLLF